MSPGPSPSRHDDAARRFLDAAAVLIDSALSEDAEHQPRRLRYLHYPAALDWMRIEDVLAVARTDHPTASKKALHARWPTKDELVRDAIVHAMLYRDNPSADPATISPRSDRLLLAGSPSEGIALIVDELISDLLMHPRSFLLAHIAPLLPRHPALAAQVADDALQAHHAWMAEYPIMLHHLGCSFRPDWPAARVTLSLQIVLDGFVLRARVNPDQIEAAAWQSGSLFADTIIAFINGILDFPSDGLTSRAWLDRNARRGRVQALPGNTSE